MFKKICKLCGKEFETSYLNQVYCNKEHYSKCKVCNKEYLLTDKRKMKAVSEGSLCLCGDKECKRVAIKESLNKTCNERYGKSCPLAVKEFRDKATKTRIIKYGNAGGWGESERNKRIIHSKEKYGTTYTTQSKEVKDKIKDSYIEKYSVDHPNKSEEVQTKRRSKCLANFGVSHCNKLEINKEKIKKTNLENNGGIWNLQTKEFRDKSKEYFLKNFGVEYPCLLPQCINAQGHTNSLVNKRFQTFLNDNGVKWDCHDFVIKRMSYDVKISNSNILIEINPTYTHNSYKKAIKGFIKPGISFDYHFNKSKLAEDNGYHCIHVWDWDNWDDIIKLIKDLLNNTLDINDCKWIVKKDNELIVDRSKIPDKLLINNNYKLLKITEPECNWFGYEEDLPVYDCGKSYFKSLEEI